MSAAYEVQEGTGGVSSQRRARSSTSGGNIELELLAILVQRPYEMWQTRGVEPTERPFNGFFGPKVVVQNWRSASNAEMFPAGFRALELGKVIGLPTMGAVIGTGSFSLMLAGHDRQIEAAVREVMKDLKPVNSVAKSGKE